MVRSLDKKWKELLYSFSAFGPNFLMVFMGAYFTDAVNPTALADGSIFAITGACMVLPALFPILWMIAKAFDGLIDIPFAHFADTLKTKFGRYRLLIGIGFIPMVLGFAMCWIPIGSQTFNTIWIFVWALIFFAFYTLNLISFYGSLSTVCSDDGQRSRVSAYKAFFDTISYCIVYALVPIILEFVPIDTFALVAMVMMTTILIPIFLIKEGAKYGYPENQGVKEEKVGLLQSIKVSFSNKLFLRWIIVNCCSFFGLQMFLVGMNAMINGGMGFNGGEMAIINTCAFAPVPMMLWLFNKLAKKKGTRFAYQTCLIGFALAILSFFFASKFICGDNKILQYVISITGGLLGSWSIGSFFMMPLLIPNQIASAEKKYVGRNHSAMYFAAQAVSTTIVGALASLVYENIKMLFIVRGQSGVIWSELNAADLAASLGVEASQVFNLGTLIVPFVVLVMCLVGFAFAFRMPKSYNQDVMAEELKKIYPDADIKAEKVIEEQKAIEKERDSVFIGICLSILSGFIFGFIWLVFIMKSVAKITGQKKTWLWWVLSCFVPFFGLYYLLKTNKQLQEKAKEQGVKVKDKKIIHIIFSILFPILPINVVSLACLQVDVNGF